MSELITAALFHDLGHLLDLNAPQMDDLGVLDHEDLGAELLAEYGFNQEVCDLIRLHVQAKRYLAEKPKYYQQLSIASKGTLEWQGGPMNGFEGQQFEKISYFHDALKLRVWDEQAKRTDITSPKLSNFRQTVKDTLTQNNRLELESLEFNADKLRDFSEHGFLHRNPFSPEELDKLNDWATELNIRPINLADG